MELPYTRKQLFHCPINFRWSMTIQRHMIITGLVLSYLILIANSSSSKLFSKQNFPVPSHNRSKKTTESKSTRKQWNIGTNYNSSKDCDSIILLSPGRTATETVSQTMVDSTKIEFCKSKEYYGHGLKPSYNNLHSCFQSKINKGGAYIHVKPEHIILNGGKHDKGSKYIRTPETFFLEAKKAGFNIVVTSFRENLLAKTISAFELDELSFESEKFLKKAKEKFIDRNLIEYFESIILDFNRAVIAARNHNFTILPISFNEIISSLCSTTRKIASIAKCPKFRCWQEVGHRSTSHRHKDLTGRIGEEAALSVKTQLNNTPYSWMLNLTVSVWPLTVPRPIEVIHQ